MTRDPRAGVVEPAREFVVDVPTVGDLWPFGQRSKQHTNGTPLGIDPNSGELACYDPHTAFLEGDQRAAQLAILAANGNGKSVLSKKLITGLSALGIKTIVPADFKNEYAPLIHHLGGTTLKVDRQGGLNLLDPGESIQLATATGAPETVIDELKARRSQLVATVAAISRNAPLTGWEQTALTTAINMLPTGATINQLPLVFTDRIDDLATTLSRTTERGHELLEPLALDVAALANGQIGQALGTSGAHQAWTINQPLVIDTQAILISEKRLTAAVIVTCWAAAQAAIHLANSTSSEIHGVVFDEIWRATRNYPELADEIGGMLRMDRNDGIVSIIVTHSWTDTEQTGGSNILARCAAFALGGMQTAEIDTIANAGIGLNQTELNEIRRNTAGGTNQGTASGGVGKFLLKLGEQPGRMIETILTPTETELLDTNQQWREP